jgi:hypothetical protein
MRGKKSDPIFIAEFISEAVQHGMETTDEIVQDAKKKIEKIDQEIVAMEAKKILRSKLLDVIASFEKQVKNTSVDANMLPFFKLDYPNTCKGICNMIKDLSSLQWSGLKGSTEHNFCIKQMIEAKIITRAGDLLIRGERFDEYIKFVLRE